MNNQNNIEELFREKLSKFEASPKANAWSAIKAGLHTTAAAGGATSVWVSTAIVATSITIISVLGYFYFNSEGEKRKVTAPSAAIEESNSTIDDESNTITATTDTAITISEKTVEEVATPQKKIAQKNSKAKPAAIRSQKGTTATKETNQVDGSTTNSPEKSIEEIIAENQTDIENTQDLIDSSDKTTQTSSATTKEKNDQSIVDQNSVESEEDLMERQMMKLLSSEELFPNVFTPDLDGFNDYFIFNPEKKESIDNLINHVEVQILSKTGKVIGQFVGKSGNWNGYMTDGTKAPTGQYSYMAIIYANGKRYPVKGSFTIF